MNVTSTSALPLLRKFGCQFEDEIRCNFSFCTGVSGCFKFHYFASGEDNNVHEEVVASLIPLRIRPLALTCQSRAKPVPGS